GKANDSSVAARPAREHDLGAAATPVSLLEHHPAGALVEMRLCGGRQLRSVQRVAKREVVLLDADDVREVRPEVQLDGEGERGARLVADDHMILEAVANEAVSRDREGILVQTAGQRVAGVEGRREVLDPARREQQGPLAVDGERERREKA